jgi:hypothetical protein
VVTCRTTDGVVFATPVDLWQELGYYKSFGRVFDMLSECPPTKVIEFFNFLIRTLEAGNIVSHPICGVVVGYGLSEMGMVIIIEVFNIVPEVVGFQDFRLAT